MKAELAQALERFSGRTAIVLDDGRQFSFGDLAETAQRIGEQLPATKAFIVVSGGNTYFTIAAYVAALTGGHLVHVVDAVQYNSREGLEDAYHPDCVIRCDDAGYVVETVAGAPSSPIHDDLTVLFSTSGSTGSSKLVKITHANLLSNTRSIIEYLALRPDDRAITLLKPHYSFGLSVINSHLLCGGSLLVTERSIQDPDIWSLMARHTVTNFSGVPHTFEVIADSLESLSLVKSLRFVTQAGGKLQRDLVRRFAQAGERAAWQFYVMYGQTEASPRISYLPPELAVANPESIGIAIPGGRLEIEDDQGQIISAADVDGELIYYGPNVFAGYARSRAELATVEPGHRLATGDIAHRKSNGLFVITGRKSRFIKPLGIRISLDEVEEVLRQRGLAVAAVPREEKLLVVVENNRTVQASEVAALVSIAPALVQVHYVDRIARLSNGKIDYAGLAKIDVGMGRKVLWQHPFQFVRDVLIEMGKLLLGSIDRSRSVAAIFRDLLLVDAVNPGDSFVSLGGDSMSYVELSVQLEDILGTLPANWHLLTVQELDEFRLAAGAQ